VSGLLLGPQFTRRYEDRIAAIERESGISFERIVLPDGHDARLPPEAVARIELAFFSADVFPEHSPAFFAAVSGAEKLRWLHLFNTGTDHPVFRRFLERGVVVTNSPGANARPIAQSALAGLLALARRFPRFAEAQREREWLSSDALAAPPDLEDQTLVVVGLGAIGSEIARLARALGLRVIGVRRSPRAPDDPVDELVTPAELSGVLPRADWLALACPLSEETRGWIDAAALACLPRGACLLNVARGPIIDEPALIDALRSGALGGAYLDVFETEPLPERSPLWTLPNVILTPHASSISAGSRARQAEIFLANLERWVRRTPLAHIVR
jgi:phosphoglycerate dehydrogenase-like enzyme